MCEAQEETLESVKGERDFYKDRLEQMKTRLSALKARMEPVLAQSKSTDTPHHSAINDSCETRSVQVDEEGEDPAAAEAIPNEHADPAASGEVKPKKDRSGFFGWRKA
ncbi:hypothetical protein AGDE_15172 [Angomonas deanei]|uniref:Uncharacterized protein n=1 Tax=Angomonas deanei TaxID=59799 RepID=A0A7G2C1B7_9TRYP|nr:hypothetical protein AGDE_15172 [Angomonas deanei]CAD2213001.1 hypothetical protein, conserved [Angomonas deanei]|eukprot:EPY19580.1 hypothetical protein AGDE_15172 [Angomonas deanei]